MESLEEEISSVHFQASQLYTRVEDGDRVLKEIVEGEDKIRKMKEQIVKLMVEEARGRDARSEASSRSKSSRIYKVSSEERGKNMNEPGDATIHIFYQNLKRVKNQIELLKDLFKVEAFGNLREEILRADEILAGMRDTAEKESELAPISRVKYMLEMISEKEAEILEYKRNMARHISRMEKDDRSATSCSTRRTRLTDASNSSRCKERKEVKDKEEGKVMQVDILRNDLEKWKAKLAEEKKKCLEAMRLNSDKCSAGEQIRKMEETFNQVENVVFRLREQLPSIEMNDMTNLLEVEDNEVFEIKKQMVKRMATADKRGSVYDPGKIKDPLLEEGGINPIATTSRRLEGEAARIKSRLDNQKSIIDDLLNSDNEDLLNQEIQVLDKVYDDYVAVIAQLRESSSVKEAERLSGIIDREDAGVFKKKEL